MFMESEEARPLRILAEYLEPLRRFRAQNIQDTVVFFGSARIRSRQDAEHSLRQFKPNGDAFDSETLIRHEKAVEWSRFYEEARELSRLLTAWTTGSLLASASTPARSHG